MECKKCKRFYYTPTTRKDNNLCDYCNNNIIKTTINLLDNHKEICKDNTCRICKQSKG